jgi:hypothetical protein
MNTVILEPPIDFRIVKQIISYTYTLDNIVPNQSVDYKIVCFAVNSEVVKVLIGKIEGAEYTAWGNNDVYIEDIIKQKVLALAY